MCWNPVVLKKKKKSKTFKKLLLWAQLAKKGVIMCHIQNEKHFFARNNKSTDHQPSETDIIYISKYHMVWLS